MHCAKDPLWMTEVIFERWQEKEELLNTFFASSKVIFRFSSIHHDNLTPFSRIFTAVLYTGHHNSRHILYAQVLFGPAFYLHYLH